MQNSIVATRDMAEALSYWATTGGIIVAVVAGAAAYWKYRRDRAAHDWDRAYESYKQFIDLAIAHPEFHPGFWTAVAATDKIACNKYRWFMARFLWACEEVLLCTADSREWRESLTTTLLEHVDYLASPEGSEDLRGYYEPVQRLVAEALEQASRASAGDRIVDGLASAERATGPDIVCQTAKREPRG